MPPFPVRPASALALGLALAALPVPAAAQAQPAPPQADVPSAFPFEKATAQLLGTTMTYVDEGEGPTVLFLHGNPTSSYLWRNVIPHVTAAGYRAVAPDLIGMGDSGKPDIAYDYADHAMHLSALLDALALEDVVLVVHDWGSVLGMEIARNQEGTGAVRGLAFMEAAIPPALPAPSYEAMGEQNARLFRFLRSEEGQQAILEQNYFVEEILGRVGVARPLPDAAMDRYRAPFPTAESRRPTAEWPRQIPIAGEPAETAAVIEANGDWLYSSDVPKLMFSVVPGALMPPPVVEFVQANASNLTHVPLGQGVHFVQEDHPDAIGTALVDWLATLPE